MAENKKFLDQEGVKFLWSKISMQDYPNNDTLMAVIEAIDETKADKTDLVQSDWNELDETNLSYIKNKPFGISGTPSDTLTWDGNTEDRVNVMGMYYHVSDCVLSMNDFVNGATITVTGNDDGEIYTEIVEISYSEIEEFYDSYNCIGYENFLIVPYDNFEIMGIVFPKAGIYSYFTEYEYMSGLTIPNYQGFGVTITTLDEKFIPDTIARITDIPEGFSGSWNDLTDKPFYEEYSTTSDTLTWDGNTNGRVCVMDVFYHVSDAIPTLDDFVNGCHGMMMYNGVGEEYIVEYEDLVEEFNELGIIMGESFLIIPNDDFFVEAAGITFPKAGVYFAASDEAYVNELTIPNYGQFIGIQIKTIDDKFISGTFAKQTYVDRQLDDKAAKSHGHKIDEIEDLSSELSSLRGAVGSKAEAGELLTGEFVVRNASFAGVANYAESADKANKADSASYATEATKAYNDGSGNGIEQTYETKTDANAKLAEANNYTDNRISEANVYADTAAATAMRQVQGGADEPHDTLKKLADLIDENTDALQTLEEVATSKADKSDIVQSDWDQNDVESLDYVKNRTHYEEEITEVILEEQIVEFRMTPANYVADFSSNFSLIENENYTVIWDGASYDVTCQYDSVIGGHYLGDKNYLTNTASVGDIPFAIIVSDSTGNASSATNSTETSHTIGIIKHTIDIHTLDEKYIPNTIARDLDLEVINYNLTNQIHYNSEQILRIDETLLEKADKTELVQSDWNQNDEETNDYIKNRTHYVDVATEVLLAERTVEEVTAQIGELDGVAFWTGTQTFIYNTLIITFDGVKYQLDAFTYDSRPYWGDSRLIGETNNISDVPFLIETGYGYAEGTFFGEEIPVWNVSLNDSIAGTPHTIKIEFENGVQYHTLDEKYIPDTIARMSNIPEGLPSYTAEDEGKILRIVNGAPTWVSLPNAEEASF